MTHDELVLCIIKLSESNLTDWKIYPALRAVVELHKPVMAFTGGYDGEENELWAEQCSDCSNNGFSQEYPCPTIEAIEKELGL